MSDTTDGRNPWDGVVPPQTATMSVCPYCNRTYEIANGHYCPALTLPTLPEKGVQYHQWLDKNPTLNVKVERNSRGINYEATVLGARSVEEAVRLVRELTASLGQAYYGEAPPAPALADVSGTMEVQ